MSQRVLVPFNESEPATEALEEALEEHHDDEIVVLHVIDSGTTTHGMEGVAADDLSGRRHDEARELLADVEERADRRGVSITTAIEEGEPADAIVEYAEENDVDRILIGSHDRSGVSRILLGSIAENVVKKSPVTVTVVR
jgi:nucleotide-binding universal stress UspA family protein